MQSGYLSRKIYIASLLYFILGKYNLLLSTFNCCHEKGKVDETRRSDFLLFQVFFIYFFHFYHVLFSVLVLSCHVTRSQIKQKRKYIQMAIDQRPDNKTRITLHFV